MPTPARPTLRPASRLVLPLLALALVAAGCGGGSEAGDEPSQAAATPSTDLPTGDVDIPEGVTPTKAGTELAFGETATVAYEPNTTKASVLELTVAEVQAGRIADLAAFQLDAATKRSTPYYVTVRVENVGTGDLGGAAVPLFAVDGADTLIQPSSFTSDFDRCPSEPLPEKFGEGARTTGCLVYLVPDRGELTAVSFRPLQTFEPITWDGKVLPAAKKKARR
ncbi:hypothetical protein ASG49_15940 [Marmoricola sp. Leaf446]|uniref:hypothetical protein n=1 Tax=Marmoricola sp. Leaf446 TaxID=1736379 RepID=UPI0006F3E18A|nr:hypothetical protein [Marmoricola sp. Leaf446]KQT89273.1 hypothetical protein ASG49_15940 [Marmoricola sp. Leaf446]